VCTKAVAVVRAVGADFFLDRWHVEIVSNNSIRHIRVELCLTQKTGLRIMCRIVIVILIYHLHNPIDLISQF
jgi:hypothetical protein